MKPMTRSAVLALSLAASVLTGACASLLDAQVKIDGNEAATTPDGAGATDGNATSPTGNGNANAPATNPNKPASNGNTVAGNGNLGVDSSGCAIAVVKYTGTVDTILQAKCNGCHNNRAPMMTNYAQAMAAWKTGGAQASVDNNSMPIGGITLTTAQKCALTNWRTSGYGQ